MRRALLQSLLVLLAVFLVISSAFSAPKPSKCSWEACEKTKKDMLNVHLVAHTHDDAGWLKTVDQYYWGSKKRITPVGVQYILDTVVTELQKNPKRRFSYAETAFFWRWWMMQNDYLRHQVRNLVNDGQLEFIGGGWVQNDEAAAHYTAIIDQMTFGLDKLNETFGRCGKPLVAWQIDPFGHSREQASLFAQMDLKALFFSRYHYGDRAMRWQNKSLEMIWRGSDDLGVQTDVFTGAFLHDTYGPPASFCFDALCGCEPIMDDDRLEGYNVQQRVDKFINLATNQSLFYRTNNIMLTMGGDFQFTNAASNFVNMDKLIEHVNERQAHGSKVNVMYSTPACYVRAVGEHRTTFPTKSDDFFPYADSPFSYWTGYFSSRPTFKAYIRDSSAMLQMCKQLDATALLGPADLRDIESFKKAVALAQHHDSVTGTAKQAVTDDYEKRLSNGRKECQQVVNDAFSKLLPLHNTTVPQQYFCELSNITVCNVTKTNHQFTVTVFNSQAHQVTDFIRVPFYNRGAVVKSPTGATVGTQVVKTFAPLTQMAYAHAAPYELVIPVTIGPLGFATYFVAASSALSRHQKSSTQFRLHRKRTVKLHNDMLSCNFNGKTGLLEGVEIGGMKLPLKQDFLFYYGKGYSKDKKSASGAYIFQPNGTKAFRVATGQVQLTKITGPLVTEMRQIFSPWASQVIRVYKDKPYVEFEWTIGPIPGASEFLSHEVITRFQSNISSNGEFYTDANGRQMMHRKLNFQPTYPYNNTEPVAGNYYPINSRIFIKDSNTQLTILTDRSQGGSSLADGAIEILLHRRLFYLDFKGVGEALNETGVDGRGLVARGKFWLTLSQPAVAARLHRPLAMDLFHKPLATFAPLTSHIADYQQKYRTSFAQLSRNLPANVHLLTMEQWQGQYLLIRLEHIYQNHEDAHLSTPVVVDLTNVFQTFDLLSVEELNLAANRLKGEWRSVLVDTSPSLRSQMGSLLGSAINKWLSHAALTINLKPMEIRTFRCVIRPKQL